MESKKGFYPKFKDYVNNIFNVTPKEQEVTTVSKKPVKVRRTYDFTTYVDSKYNEKVFSIVNDIVSTARQTKISLRQNGKDDTGNPMFNQLRYRPTASDTFSSFYGVMLTTMLLEGNSYAIIHRKDGNLGLRNFERFEFISSSNVVVKRHPETDERLYTVTGYDRDLGSHEILHYSNTTLNNLYGYKLVDALTKTLKLHDNLDEHINNKLAKHDLPFYVKNKLDYNNDTEEDEAIAQLEMYKEILSDYTTNDEIVVLNSDEVDLIKFQEQEVPFNPEVLEGIIEKRIAHMFNYPLSRFSRSVENISETQQAIFTQTVAPLYQIFEDELTRKLLTPYELDKGYTIEFDQYSRLKTDIKTAATSFKELIRAGVVSPDEGRRILGFEEKGGLASELFVSADLIPVNSLNTENNEENNDYRGETGDDG